MYPKETYRISPIKETFLDKLKLLSVDKNYYKGTMKSCDITG